MAQAQRLPALTRAISSLRPFLAMPWAYRAFGIAIGAHSARSRFVSEHVRPWPGARVLDIGCGTGDLFPYLEGTEYVGFDASPSYVEAARARYGQRGRFVCERVDAHVGDGLPPFDLAIASGVIHHLDDPEALQLFRLAHAALRPGGRLVTYDGCYREGQGAGARFLLSQDRGPHVRTEGAYRELASTVFSRVESRVREDLLRIPYTHLIMDCTRGPA